MKTLASSPAIGRLRPDLRRGMRSLSMGRYIIFYECDDQVVRLLRVLHGARDIGPAMFESGD
jgi:toxin ParE1/3/4